MAETMTADRPISARATGHRALSEWPGWDYVPGIAFFLVGVLALAAPPIASFATGIYLGAMLTVAGAFVLAAGIASIRARGAWMAIILGLLSVIAGMLTLYNPVAGAISLVWVMGAWLIVGGIFELGMSLNVRAGKGWLILVGLVNLALGVVLMMTNETEAFRFLGYFVGLSLVFRGVWSMFFTADLHRAHHFVDSALG